ncbi:hypothetical protein [Micromonospora sp. DT47]
MSVGLHCLADDTLGVYADWKIDYAPTHTSARKRLNSPTWRE